MYKKCTHKIGQIAYMSINVGNNIVYFAFFRPFNVLLRHQIAEIYDWEYFHEMI